MGRRVAGVVVAMAIATIGGCGLDVLGQPINAGWEGSQDAGSRSPDPSDSSQVSTKSGMRDEDGSSDGGADAVRDGDAGPCALCGPEVAQTVCVANACVAARRVFVSSTESTANLGGVAGADAKCQSLATAAGIAGTWKAWVSSSASSPNSRFTNSNVPYRLLDGTLIANNWNDLTNKSLAHAIDRDEKGLATVNTEVWTATKADGTFDVGGCDGFTSADVNSNTARQGLTSKTNGEWTYAYLQYCDRTNGRLYCFEQ